MDKNKGNKIKIYRYTVVFEPLREGGYNIFFPAIPEICSFGETLEEARRMAKDALKCYLESALEQGESIPEDKEAAVDQITIGV